MPSVITIPLKKKYKTQLGLLLLNLHNFRATPAETYLQKFQINKNKWREMGKRNQYLHFKSCKIKQE